MPLSDAAIRSARPREKPFKLYDGDGLYVLVAPNGSKLWRMKYRLRVANSAISVADQGDGEGPRRRGRPAKDGAVKEGLLSFGSYPELGLKAARVERDKARTHLAEGRDPAREKRREEARKLVSDAATFDAVAGEFIAKREREGLAPATLKTYRLFQAKLRPEIGRYPIEEIEPRDLLAALREIEKTGRLETASRCREFAGRVFRYAIATARAKRDIAADLRGALTAPVVRGLAAVTDPKRVGEILRAIDAYQGQPSTMMAMKLAPLLFQRPGEVTGMRWDELDLDAKVPVWRVPAGRKKERRDHVVPLPTQAVEILRQAQALSPGGPFVFPGLISNRRPITTTTLAHGLRRIGIPNEEHVTHGWRKTASTLLNESGKWSADAIERALAHQDASVRGIYNIGAYWDERIRMAQWWSDYLDALRKGAEVIPLRPAGCTPH